MKYLPLALLLLGAYPTAVVNPQLPPLGVTTAFVDAGSLAVYGLTQVAGIDAGGRINAQSFATNMDVNHYAIMDNTMAVQGAWSCVDNVVLAAGAAVDAGFDGGVPFSAPGICFCTITKTVTAGAVFTDCEMGPNDLNSVIVKTTAALDAGVCCFGPR